MKAILIGSSIRLYNLLLTLVALHDGIAGKGGQFDVLVTNLLLPDLLLFSLFTLPSLFLGHRGGKFTTLRVRCCWRVRRTADSWGAH